MADYLPSLQKIKKAPRRLWRLPCLLPFTPFTLAAADAQQPATGIATTTVIIWTSLLVGAFGLTLLWIRSMKKEVASRRLAEQNLAALLQDTADRIKELQCMYEITQYVRSLDRIDDFLQASAFAIPEGWRHPEQIHVRITFDEQDFTTVDFAPGEWQMDSLLLVDGNPRGVASVFHVDTLQVEGNPFSGEEQELLDGIAATLGEAIRRKEAEDKLQMMATSDPLTGLFNRGALETRLVEECARSSRYQHPLSLLFLDLDHFKSVNDTHGHRVGDQVLRAVASCMTECVRDIDFCGRYGGEEFAVLLPETDAAAALAIGERLRQQIAELKVSNSDGARLALSVSIGMANFPLDTDAPKLLLEYADQAMYLAKDQGRNCVMEYPGPDDSGVAHSSSVANLGQRLPPRRQKEVVSTHAVRNSR